jgi:hypothetical protein
MRIVPATSRTVAGAGQGSMPNLRNTFISSAERPVLRNGTNSNKASSRFLEDGSYLKLRNLTIGYNLALPEWYISNLRLFVSGENLFTLTDYSGVDPEIPPHDGKITGVTTAVYPSTRKFMFGLNVTF